MPADTFACPECRAVLVRSLTLQPGETVMCPRCRLQFPCPPPGTFSRPTAPAALSTPPTAYTEAPPPPLAGEDAFPEMPPPRELPLPFDGSEEDEDHPHSLGTSAWFRYAREHWGSIVGPSAGFCLMYVVILLGLVLIPCVGVIFALFVLPPLQAGVSIVALDQLKGKKWHSSTFCSGFNSGWAIIGIAFYTLLMSLLLIPLMIFLSDLLDDALIFPLVRHPEEFVILFAASAVGASLFAFLYTRLLTFALPLVLDRNYGATEALAGSWTLTRGRVKKHLGLNIALWLINLGGALCFGVGLLLAVPFTALVWNAGYLLLAGTQPPVAGGQGSRQDQERYDAFRGGLPFSDGPLDPGAGRDPASRLPSR